MIRGFLSGVFWGAVVAGLGLGAVSQLTPLPVARIAADASAVERAKPVPVDPAIAPTEPAAEPPAEPAAEPAAEPPVAPAGQAPATDAVAAPQAEEAPVTDQLDPPAGSEFTKPLPDADPVAPATEAVPPPGATEIAPLTPPPASDAAKATDAPSAAPQTGLEPPEPLDVPTEADAAAVPPAAVDAGQIALADPVQPTAPIADAPPAPTIDPPPQAKPEPDEVLLKPLPEILPAPEAEAAPSLQLVPDAQLVPESDPAAVPDAENSATLAPTPGLAGEVDGVKTGRLPRIGDVALPADGAESAALAPADENATPEADLGLAIEGDADLPPLQKYARAFENPDAKPLFSIILIDTGGADIDRASLAALPFPVTFALDPLALDAAAASKIYRDAGQEVIMVATGIPAGATASDLEVTFQAHASALPEAVAVIDTEFGSFQADRPLATQVVPILKAQGRGLISWDRGLNAADQVARREGLAATMVFRKLDGKGENTAAVRRALDRAAFKAAQDGRVTVIGQTIPETVAALLEWAVEGRAASMALAPVSAVLTVP